MRRIFGLAAILVGALVLGGALTVSAASGTFSLFGSATPVPGGVQLMSNVNTGLFGGIDYQSTGVLTVGQITNLSVTYQFLSGDCGVGSPRISIITASGKSIFVYIGPPPSFTGCGTAQTNTGNLLTSGNRCDFSQLGGGTDVACNLASGPYAAVVVTDVALVDDDGAAPSNANTVIITNYTVNADVFPSSTQAPTKSCSTTNPKSGSTTTCTIKISNIVPQNGTITDTVTSPPGAQITSCSGQTGGLVCGTPAGNSVVVACMPTSPATFCDVGSSFQVTITSVSGGPLTEEIAVTPTIGGAPVSFSVSPSQAVTFGSPPIPPVLPPTEVAPTKRCTATSVALGGSTTCTLTLSTQLGPTSYLTDSITSPSGGTISSCSAAGGLSCQPLGSDATSVTVNCPGPSSCPVGATVTLTITSSTVGPLSETVAITPAGFLTQSFTVTPSPAVSFTDSPAPAPTQSCNGQVIPLSALCVTPSTTPSGPSPLPVVIPFPPGLT